MPVVSSAAALQMLPPPALARMAGEASDSLAALAEVPSVPSVSEKELAAVASAPPAIDGELNQ